MTVNIGIDERKEKREVCWLRDVSTGKKKRKVFRNKRQSFADIIQWINKNTKTEPQRLLMTLDATGVYHDTLIYFLHEQSVQLFLANPGKAKKYAEALGRVHKTDKSDAAMLARYGRSQPDKMVLWQAETPHVRALKALLRRLDALEKEEQREKNRLVASEISACSERVLQSIGNMILVIETEIVGLKQEIDAHIERHPILKNNRQLLKSIKGIGDVMARELVYLVAAKDFKTAKQIAAYIGLIPKLKESGKFKGHTTMSKTGPSRLRAKRYMAAVSACQHNPDIKVQRARLLKAGKTRMQA